MHLADLLNKLKEDRHQSFRDISKDSQKAISYSFLCEISKGKWLPKTAKLIEFCKNLNLDPDPYVKALTLDKGGRSD